MVDRLMDDDPQREQRRQEILMAAIEKTYTRKLAAEIQRASRDMLSKWALIHEVPFQQEHVTNIEAIYSEMVQRTVQTFGSRVYEQDKSANLPMERKESFAQWMARMALWYISTEASRRKISSITETTRTTLIALINAGFTAGKSQAEIIKSITTKLPIISKTKAQRIARTEVHGAANFGAMEAAKRSSTKKLKEWIASHDERTRDTHAEASGQIREMDEPFLVGDSELMFPGDPNGPPEEVINCRCAVGYIVKLEGED